MNVDIFIISQSDDESNSYFADGGLCITDDGFVLSYTLGENDENRLVYNGKSICQSRTGGLTYSVEFIQGQKCAFMFKEMGMLFSHEVEVHRVEASLNDKGCMIEILYSVCNSPRDEFTKIFITAKYKKS